MVVRATQRSNVVGWPANQTHEQARHAIALFTCQARIELRSQARTGCGILDTEPVRRTCSRAQRERIAPHSQEIYAHCLCCTAVRNKMRPQDGPQQTAALFRQCSKMLSPAGSSFAGSGSTLPTGSGKHSAHSMTTAPLLHICLSWWAGLTHTLNFVCTHLRQQPHMTSPLSRTAPRWHTLHLVPAGAVPPNYTSTQATATSPHAPLSWGCFRCLFAAGVAAPSLPFRGVFRCFLPGTSSCPPPTCLPASAFRLPRPPAGPASSCQFPWPWQLAIPPGATRGTCQRNSGPSRPSPTWPKPRAYSYTVLEARNCEKR